MKIRPSKESGEWAEMRFMTKPTEQDFQVTKPWGKSSPYDLAIDLGMRFVSVQVKSTMHRRSPCAKRPRPCFAVNLRGGGNRTYHRPNFHCLGPYVIPKDIWYIVPFVLVTTRNEGSRSFRHYKYSAAAGVNTGTINVTPPANPNHRVLTYRCTG